jgi:hypothetical protein
MGKRLLFVLVFLVGCETTGTSTGPASSTAAKPGTTPAARAAATTAAKRDKLEGIPVVWKPTTNVAAVGAVDLTGLTNVKVQVARLGDKRDDPGLIGENREKQPPRKVTTPDDVAGFVTDHVKSLMRGAGVNVVDGGGSATVKGEIQQFFVAETDTYKGDVRIHFSVTNAAGKVTWNGVVGGSSTRFGRSYKDENYYETLSDSLIDATYNLLKTPAFRDALLRK